MQRIIQSNVIISYDKPSISMYDVDARYVALSEIHDARVPPVEVKNHKFKTNVYFTMLTIGTDRIGSGFCNHVTWCIGYGW